ncbi:N-acetylneuraminic acid synthase-like protein, partial [human gut metagenome]
MASKKVIVLTQPFSKDCDISDEEQVEMYRNMIVPYGESNVIIKPHPRETLPYRHFYAQ